VVVLLKAENKDVVLHYGTRLISRALNCGGGRAPSWLLNKNMEYYLLNIDGAFVLFRL
jgi:hypothetical protein